MVRLMFIGVVLASVILPLLATNDTFQCYVYDSEKDTEPKKATGCKACVNVTLPHSGVYPYHTKFTEGCSYQVEEKLGCKPVDDQGKSPLK
jgi:hypothetical protein